MLGGGGVTGVAWETGLLTGLAEQGLDLTRAERVVGTSAGSVVAAQLTTGTPLSELYRRQLEAISGEVAASLGLVNMTRFMLAMATSRSLAAYRARIARMALGASTVDEAARRKVIEVRLPVHEWPERQLLITAVNTRTFERRAFDRESGVLLIDAVAASCAVPGVWPPVTLLGDRWMDGGIGAPANVDLAAGAEKVVVVAPITGGFGALPSVKRSADELRAGGAKVVVVAPDAPSKKAIGRNLLDPNRRAPAARAGHEQAERVVEAVRRVWA